MYRKQSILFVSCLLLFHVACGSGSGGGAGGSGTTATGGHSSGTGGVGTTGGAGGKISGTGGFGTGGQGGSLADAAGTGGAGAQDGGRDSSIADVAVDAAVGGPGDASADGGTTLTSEQTRGQYLVKNVLNCSSCHTPTLAAGGPDNSKFLAGNDCFTKDTATGGCLASANLTNDETGLKNLTDQQIKNAFTKGIDPDQADGSVHYLFAQMPYYQFSNLTDGDAQAIVAYLRTVAGVSHDHPANGGPFTTQPTTPQWLPVALADLPSAASDAGTGVANGKYLSALMCSTCHTVNTSSTAPLQLNAAMAFLGGKEFTTTLTVAIDGGTSSVDGGAGGVDGATGSTTTLSKKIQSANLTSDPTGLKNWTVQQIVTAIKSGKDEAGRSICSPMRPFPGLTDQDAADIANYLQAIPPVANALTETCE